MLRRRWHNGSGKQRREEKQESRCEHQLARGAKMKSGRRDSLLLPEAWSVCITSGRPGTAGRVEGAMPMSAQVGIAQCREIPMRHSPARLYDLLHPTASDQTHAQESAGAQLEVESTACVSARIHFRCGVALTSMRSKMPATYLRKPILSLPTVLSVSTALSGPSCKTSRKPCCALRSVRLGAVR